MSTSSNRAGDSFTPAWWVPGPHLQTAWGRMTRPRRQVPMRREAIATPDGDTLLLDHLEGPRRCAAPPSRARPRGQLLLGLRPGHACGRPEAWLARHGVELPVLRARPEKPRQDASQRAPSPLPLGRDGGPRPRGPHAVRARARLTPRGRRRVPGRQRPSQVAGRESGPGLPRRAAAALSTPYDLAAGSRYLETWIGLIYCEKFLKTLRPKAFDVARRFPEAAAKLDLPRIRRARTFWEFDDAATGPLHGFEGAEDYYARSSSLNFLGRIATPTYCLSAEDDAFLPAFRPAGGPPEGVLLDRLPNDRPRRPHRVHRRPRSLAPRLLGRRAGGRLARGAGRLSCPGHFPEALEISASLACWAGVRTFLIRTRSVI